MTEVDPRAVRVKSKAAFPLTRLNGRADERVCSAARQNPFHRRVETRRRCGDIVRDCLWYCRPIHSVQCSRNAVITGHSAINVGLHLHAEIGFLMFQTFITHTLVYTACIQIKCGLRGRSRL